MPNDFYQRIGNEALHACGSAPRVLLYAEVEEDSIAASIFCQHAGENLVRFRFVPEPLLDLVWEFWESGGNRVEPQSWTVLRFVIADGRFTADLTYPNELDPKEFVEDRRSRAVAQYFPDLRVDYSQPDG